VLGDYSFVSFALSIPLRGCNANPRIPAHIVFGDALAFDVTHTKIVLRLLLPLFCRLGEPVNRLGMVFGDAIAVRVHRTKHALRPRIPLFSKWLLYSDCFLIVARLKRRNSILPSARRHGRRGEQHEGGQGGDQDAHSRSVAEIDGG